MAYFIALTLKIRVNEFLFSRFCDILKQKNFENFKTEKVENDCIFLGQLVLEKVFKETC